MMNKLTISTGKAMACLILLCLFLAQGCKKDRPILTVQNQLNKQLIAEKVLNDWYITNPIAKYISLDWTKARQAVIEGQNVVRVPTLNINPAALTQLNESLKSSMQADSRGGVGVPAGNIAQSSTGDDHFYASHPPEIFFIQKGNSGKLSSYLLNFLPKDKNKDFGENGIWTGKLFEWNLTGDTIFVQELEKSNIKSKHVIKVGGETKTAEINSVIKDKKLQSLSGLKDKQTSGFFGWLIDKLGELVGHIGSWFGLSVHNRAAYDRYNDSFNVEWQLNIDIQSIFSSSGGSSGGGAGYYIAAGTQVYSDYTPGYNQEPISTISDYGNYPTTHGPNVDIQRYVVDYLASRYLLSDGAKYYLLQNPEIAEEIRKYDVENYSGVSQEQIDFVKQALVYLSINPNINLNEIKSALVKSPNIRISFADRINYPMIAKIIDGLHDKVKNDPKLMAAIKKFSQMNEAQILEKLISGKGPSLVLKDMPLGENGEENGDGNIYINKVYANGFYNLQVLPPQSLEFFLTSCILHEFVHFGNTVVMDRFPSKRDVNGYFWDAGKQFEEDYYGGDISYDISTGKIIFTKYK